MSVSERAMAYWNEQQHSGPYDAPDIRVLWQKQPVARKTHRCDRCGDEIPIGSRYESLGLSEDGAFRYERTHYAANYYPSGCPAIGERDRAEAEEQFRKDEIMFNGERA